MDEKIIDAEFTVIEPRDTRPIWKRYRLEVDWSIFWGSLLIGTVMAAVRLAGTLGHPS